MQDTIPEFSTNEDSLNIREYLALFWHWAWLILLATVLAGVAAFIYSSRITPIYEASTTLLVNEAIANKTTDYSAIMASERLTGTYAEMITNGPILADVINELSLNMTLSELQDMITVTPVRDTQLIQVSVESVDPVAAATIANTLAVTFSKNIQSIQSDRYAQSKISLQTQLTQLETQINQYAEEAARIADPVEKERLDSKVTQYRQIYANTLQMFEQIRLSEAQTISSVVQVDPAIVPSVPILPKTMQNTLLAAVVGFMLAAGGIVAREALDDTLKTPDDVTRATGLPVLGIISHYKNTEDDSLVTISLPRSPISEGFRTLRTNIQYSGVDKPLHTLLVTSAEPGEGKTTVAANLAVVLAQSERETTVVDCDFRRPTLHRRFALINRLGLSSLFFNSQGSLDTVSMATSVNNLRVVTSGHLPPNPAELLASKRMSSLITQVTDRAGIVILDTPPALAVTDACILASSVDGVLLVIRPGHTRASIARQAVEQLNRVNARVLGIVINNLNLRNSRYSYRYYRYNRYPAYYYDQDGTKKKAKKGALSV